MRILVTGASGQLGAYLIDHLRDGEHDLIAWGGSQAEGRGVRIEPSDLTDPAATARSLDQVQPDAIIHAAAISAAEAVRRDFHRARMINIEATGLIADWADRHDRRVVFTSTDLVFDGSRPWNREDDPADPILAYGRTKREAEAAVTSARKGIVARLCLLYGPSRCGRPYFFDKALDAIRGGQIQTFFEDEFRTPLDLGSAAGILVRLAESDFAGTIHVGGPERMSRFELMTRAAAALGLDSSLVRPGRRADVDLPEPRPADVSLDTSRLARIFPDLVRPTIEEVLRAPAF